ncbi:MAG: TPM domain-containing protein [Rhodobacterales bacterium]|nr:TPM domain-containing protein [Rhodobacterales bacterium]
MRILLSIILFTLASFANAQSYPDYSSTTVNDFSGLLSPEAEARVAAQLATLKSETDIEMTVVTLSRRAMFTDTQTLEEFATGLFNNWGIGDKTRNDGILVLVMRSDREMRIELGAAFGRDWDRVAEMVVDRSFLPLFKQDKYEAGIEKGVSDVIATIAMPFHNREPAPETSGGVSGWWALLIPIPLLLAAFFNTIKDRIAANRPCPKCGHKTLSVVRNTLNQATKSSAGNGERVTACSRCDYRLAVPYTISRRSSSKSSSRSSFGGGSSGGGGASGKW